MTSDFISQHKAKHLLAHVLTVAGTRRWPRVVLGDSGETATGFYADFSLPFAPDEAALEALTNAMARVLYDFRVFRSRTLTLEAARKLFRDQPWKRQFVEAVSEAEVHIDCYQLDEVVDVCDCAIKDAGELRPIHPESFVLTSAFPIIWSDRRHDTLFIRITGELFPSPIPCECCGP
jgi:threonyl-tRNA synthetase